MYFNIKSSTAALRLAFRKPFGKLGVFLILAATMAIPSSLLAMPVAGQGASPDAQRESLGSLNSAGEVYVNETKAPSELTIFSGDTVRTGPTGTAMLTTSTGNSFQVAGQSQVVFAGDPRYFAELKAGTISVKALGGAAVLAGNSAVVPTNRTERTTVTIQKAADGSFLVTCSVGDVGILPINQAPGLFLQAGQSARISATGELAANQPAPGASTGAGGTQSAGRSRNTWIYVGIGAAAAGGAAAGLALALSGHSTVSPMAP